MYLIAHAKAAFAEMGADEIVEKAKAILRWTGHNRAVSLTKRDVHQGMRGLFKRAMDLDSPLAVLVERGFIRKRPDSSTTTAGRPASPIFDVNPRLASKDTQGSREGNFEDCEDSEKTPPKKAKAREIPRRSL